MGLHPGASLRAVKGPSRRVVGHRQGVEQSRWRPVRHPGPGTELEHDPDTHIPITCLTVRLTFNGTRSLARLQGVRRGSG